MGVFTNPFVETGERLIDPIRKIFRVNFDLKYIDGSGKVQTLFTDTVQFNEHGLETMIDDGNGSDVEVTAFVAGGGTYDPANITQWGIPSFTEVQAYFDLDSVWNDLQFKEQPLKQLAIDWVLHSIKIEGLPLKEFFEYEIPTP